MMLTGTRKPALIIASMLLLMGGAKMTSAQVTVKRITYNGWEGAYRLANKTTELVFVPQIGRIMRYGLIGGANLLWNNRALDGKTTDLVHLPKDWQNYGGDKCWPAPQARWGWPPDPTLDSGRQSLKVTKQKHLRIVGQPSRKEKVQFVREIALDAEGSGVTIENTLINVSDKPNTWAVWEVAQTDNPDLIRLPLCKTGHFESGFYVFGDAQPTPVPDNVTVEGDEIHVRLDPKHASKIGNDSPLGWIVAEKDGTRFEVSQRVEAGKPYPDSGCALEIYTNDGPAAYVELELLGPLTSLTPKARVSLTTRWRLVSPSAAGRA